MLRQPATGAGRRRHEATSFVEANRDGSDKEGKLQPTTPFYKRGIFSLFLIAAIKISFGSFTESGSFLDIRITTKQGNTATAATTDSVQEQPLLTKEEMKQERQHEEPMSDTIAKEVVNPHKDRILDLVQIGRGTILRIATPFYCDRSYKHNAVQHEKCVQEYTQHPQYRQTRDENYLGELKRVLRKDPLEKPTSFVIVIQNPVDRVVSSYRASHPDNCQAFIKNTCNSPNHHMLFTVCFPKAAMEDFAQASLPNYNVPHFSKQQGLTVEQKCHCRALARKVIRGETSLSSHSVMPDMEFNYQYNAKNTYQKVPNTEVFAVRVEYQSDDVATLDKVMGGSGNNGSPLLSTIHAGQPDTSKLAPSPLSAEATKKLCCVLHEEIDLYLELFDRALNLAPRDKQEAEANLREQCGLHPGNGWDGWRRNCQERFKEPPWSKCAPITDAE